MATEILRRKWDWLGHTLRKQQEDLTRSALDWNAQGTRRKRRHTHTWRKQLDNEITRMMKTWSKITILVLNRSE